MAPVAATPRAHMPGPNKAVPAPLEALAPLEGGSIPRSTIDNPWRDLHPMRVWPD
jgi:hypothetical protein